MNLSWCLWKNPESLWARLIQTLYHPNSSILNPPIRQRGSSIWKAITIGTSLLLDDLRWKIGDGQNNSFWMDSWLPCGSIRHLIYSPLTQEEHALKVSHFISPSRT